MAVIATTTAPEETESLAQFLGAKHISFQKQTDTGAGELEMTAFFVADGEYERACDAVEEWAALDSEERNRKSGARCPSCSSTNIELKSVDETETLTKIPVIYTCKDCGRVFAPRR